MPVPIEFTSAFIKQYSSVDSGIYSGFLRSKEPYQSLYKNNPWLIPPDMKKPLEWGVGKYWETTVARKHSYWKDFDLPGPTRDIARLRSDLIEWGFCLIEDGLSRQQCAVFLSRLLDQAEAESLAGVQQMTPSGQYVNSLVNKGACFALCIEQHPDAVQAGPLIEQILNETLGKGWICHSFLANGADPGGYPQGLHIDQGPLLPWQTLEAPALVNTMFILQDIDDFNGGTLVIPGSHRVFAQAGSGGAIGELPPSINLEAAAGTIMLFDGRLLHGTGLNRSTNKRFVATMSNIKPWMRQQENWVVSVSPEVIRSASPKLLHRMGMQAVTYGATVEGFGLGASGRVDDHWGNLKLFRTALDEGNYIRVGELSTDAPAESLNQNFTVKRARQTARQFDARRGKAD